MKKLIKKIINLIPASITSPFIAYIRNKKSEALVRQWEANGKTGAAPHIVKQRIITKVAQEYRCKVLVESGTYLGDMIEAQKNCFDMIYSIELSQELWGKACHRFSNRKNITIIQGDSGKEINKILPSIGDKALFWLDGHYSGGNTAKSDKECPILEELDAIFRNNSANHVILIDDARLFNGTHDYPEISIFLSDIALRMNNYTIHIDSDIIFLLPEQSSSAIPA
ncbi:MAG: hypothetical protein KDC61_14690, partial [Saprospiraceae bacterium]|nr:hypothetical protein [Saprospiraceae bacterium]